ncbi:MAG: glucose 1-dehydrogenase [Gemmatimonadetes bacterium]|nr:glucose 1-dehydrogenase [Gemmatimonadota bacterium]
MSLSLFDLTGRVAFVTGGNGGIGKGIAVGFARAGAKVVIAARNPEKTRAAVAELETEGTEALGLTFDVTDRRSVAEAIAAAAERFGGLDILVNDAGTNIRSRGPEDMPPDAWETVIATNLTGVYNCSTLAYPEFKRRGRGKVINIGSMMSIFGTGYASAYAASKGGVVQYTKSCAVGWAKDNIQVNAILPGWITTEMARAFLQRYPERYDAIVSRTPAGRWGMPHELAGTAIFLASEASDFVTGAAIPVDGGYAVC